MYFVLALIYVVQQWFVRSPLMTDLINQVQCLWIHGCLSAASLAGCGRPHNMRPASVNVKI